MSTEPESFLARWSRRKRTAERDKDQAKTVAPSAPVVPRVTPTTEAPAKVDAASPAPLPPLPAVTPEVPLPPIESLDGLRSDYQAFFQQPVAEEIRHAALKKLFTDPHFNQMDMLDVYVDDYTQFEPLPAEMKLRLASARDFLLDSERAALEASEASSGAIGDTTETSIGASAQTQEASATPESASVQTAAPEVTPPNTSPANESEKPAESASLLVAGKTNPRNPSAI